MTWANLNQGGGEEGVFRVWPLQGKGVSVNCWINLDSVYTSFML